MRLEDPKTHDNCVRRPTLRVPACGALVVPSVLAHSTYGCDWFQPCVTGPESDPGCGSVIYGCASR
jgi:hypothetical protein